MGTISSNISLSTINETYGTSISYVSSKNDVLSNTGVYIRPYQKFNVTYNITISYEASNKTISVEVPVEGFKELENISAAYIGGNSSTYQSLSNDIFTNCDIIYCGFAYPGIDGTFTHSSVNAYNFTHYLPKMQQYVIPNAHEQGTWVVLSICGVDGEYDTALETIALDDDLIDKFINNIIGLINTYGFDGIDMDWEVPSNGALFTKLMQKLYAAVKANNPDHLVTAAIGGGEWQPPYYDLTNSAQYLDFINMMSYNMATSSGYHHTALYKSSSYDNSENKVASTLASCSIAESVKIFNDYGVPSSKIIIGSGFYGIKQTRVSTSSSWEKHSNLSYKEIVNNYLSDTVNYTYYYDETAKAPYLISKDGLTFISYDNPISIAAKCEYAKANNLAGIFAWQCAQDNGDLLNAFKENMTK